MHLRRTHPSSLPLFHSLPLGWRQRERPGETRRERETNISLPLSPKLSLSNRLAVWRTMRAAKFSTGCRNQILKERHRQRRRQNQSKRERQRDREGRQRTAPSCHRERQRRTQRVKEKQTRKSPTRSRLGRTPAQTRNAVCLRRTERCKEAEIPPPLPPPQRPRENRRAAERSCLWSRLPALRLYLTRL